MSDWLLAEHARQQLGVRAQTLYAYVSRGRIEVRADPQDSRRSLYRASDVAALRDRKGKSRKASDVAAGAIAWGEPVLSSAITTIAGGRLYYRGRDAIDLSESETLEGVARLLRGGHGVALKEKPRPPIPQSHRVQARAFSALAARAGLDQPARGRNPLAVAAEAVILLDIMADAVAGKSGEGAVHQRLAAAWDLADRPEAADLVRRALVLLADHELNASAFAARVAASTGASLAASALAGLAALSGPRHGGAAAAMRAFAAQAAEAGPRATVDAWLAQDRPIPGFGHPLYPQGDPRAEALLARVSLAPAMGELRRVVEEATGQPPNVDFALCALASALGLPEEAPFGLFAVARCAGWLAHAVEQGQSPQVIRPRARYVGEPAQLG